MSNLISLPTTLEELQNCNLISKERRSKQTCSLCKNHLKISYKKGHKKNCIFQSCDCELCLETRDRRKFSAIEKKNNYPATKIVNWKNTRKSRLRREQLCRKCLNHGEFNVMSGHKKTCPHQKCSCDKCNSTVKRRQHVKSEAKNMRNKPQSFPVQKIKLEGIETSLEEIMESSYQSDASSSTSSCYSNATSFENSSPSSPSSSDDSEFAPFNSQIHFKNNDESRYVFAGIYDNYQPGYTPSIPLKIPFTNEQSFCTQIANHIYEKELISHLNPSRLPDLKNLVDYLVY